MKKGIIHASLLACLMCITESAPRPTPAGQPSGRNGDVGNTTPAKPSDMNMPNMGTNMPNMPDMGMPGTNTPKPETGVPNMGTNMPNMGMNMPNMGMNMPNMDMTNMMQNMMNMMQMQGKELYIS